MSTLPAKAPEIWTRLWIWFWRIGRKRNQRRQKHMKALMPAKEPKRKKNAKRPRHERLGSCVIHIPRRYAEFDIISIVLATVKPGRRSTFECGETNS